MAKGKRPITIALELALTVRNSNVAAERATALDKLIELLDPMMDGRTGKLEPHLRGKKAPTAKAKKSAKARRR